ncbi:helix-turn-helix domain-containing protein [Opitutaceae bacterium]|nr:helix-turn-helix domain-containing protein [Opitutaceae bacterium]
MKTNIQLIGIKSLDTVTTDVHPIASPTHGWLKAVRNALGLPVAAVAQRLGVTVATAQAYEKREKSGTITLETLRRAVGALDCELVVAVVPRDGKSFSDLAAQHDPDLAHLRATEHSMALENQASGDLGSRSARNL